MASIAVLGATSWGVTLAWVLSLNNRDVTVVVRDEAEAVRVSSARGIGRLPEVTLPAHVRVETSIPSGTTHLVLAVPAQSLRAALQSVGSLDGVHVISAAKGIELSTGARMSEILATLKPLARVSVLSGPNLAHEVVKGLPSAAVIASLDGDSATSWQKILATPFFRFYTSDDVVGVEIAGALKNVVAIAAGAAVGLQLGANAVAAILTRGLAEITRLGVALGADPLTFQGLAGVGDLAVTCFSPLSRNHRLGELLATGATPSQARERIGEAVEGASTAPVALKLANSVGVELPIAQQVAAVLGDECDVPTAMSRLLARPLGPESNS